MQRGSTLQRGTDAKRKNVEDGLRTQEDQAAGPAYTPSELLDMAPCQAETDFTYLYIEVLRFFHNAIGCPRGPLTPHESRSSVPKFVRGNKLGDGVGDIYVRVALPSAPLSTLTTHSADGPVLPVIGCAVRGNGRDIIVAVSEVS